MKSRAQPLASHNKSSTAKEKTDSHCFLVASKASLFLWGGTRPPGPQTCLPGQRPPSPVLQHIIWQRFSKRLMGSPQQQKQRVWAVRARRLRAAEQPGDTGQGPGRVLLPARRHHKHGRCVTCGGKPSGFDLRLLAAQMYSQQPVDCCKMYEISAGKFSNILKLKTVLGPWKTAIYSLQGEKIKPPNKKVSKIYLVLPFALHKTQFEYWVQGSFFFNNSMFLCW